MSTRLLLPLCAGLLLAGCATTRPPRPSVPIHLIEVTGVASCDGYLGYYLICYRAAAIYPADQLQAHYQAMRDSLLQSAQDPKIRPYLDARCRLLNSQMRQSLHGRTCNGAPSN